jgi:hypothetical protein
METFPLSAGLDLIPNIISIEVKVKVFMRQVEAIISK